MSVKMNVPATKATPITTANPVSAVRSLRANSPRRAIRVIYATCFIRSSRASADSAGPSCTIAPSCSITTRSAVDGRARVVRDHDHGLAEVVDGAPEQPEHLARRLRVEVAGRLVGEHDRGPRDQRAGDRHPLLLPAGQLGGTVREPVAEPDRVDERGEPLVVDLRAGERQRQRDVLVRGQDRDQVVGLEDEAELVAPQRGQPLVVEVRELLAVDDDRAGRRAVQPREQMHERRLAGAGGPHDRRELAGGEADRDAAQRVDGRLPLPVGSMEVRRGDDRVSRNRGHTRQHPAVRGGRKGEFPPRAGAGSRTGRVRRRAGTRGPRARAGGPPRRASGRAWRRSR